MENAFVLMNVCPQCPVRDEVDERYTIIAQCSEHREDTSGSEDGVFSFSKDFGTSLTSEMQTNRVWSEFLNGKRKKNLRKKGRKR